MADNRRVRQVMGEAEIARSLTRIAHEIIERNDGGDGLLLLGIQSRGVPLAARLCRIMKEFGVGGVGCGSLDVTMYRDDLASQPTRTLQPSAIPDNSVDGRTVVLVDDVLCSGRTVRAGLEALGALGRPTRVQLAALVDRGHRELPIRADYVGKNLPTSTRERVRVELAEIDGADAVTIEEA